MAWSRLGAPGLTAPGSWMPRREVPRARLAKLRQKQQAQALRRRLSQSSTPRELAPREQTSRSQAPRDLALQGLQQGGTGEATEAKSEAAGTMAPGSHRLLRVSERHEELARLRGTQRAQALGRRPSRGSTLRKLAPRSSPSKDVSLEVKASGALAPRSYWAQRIAARRETLA